ncbi:MAG: hypothetical protein KKE79_05065 [Actinobacteria bacterium]|nr:hypothetical protein [Actinomycetota bacterium]MBU4302150.1 hypothetical protein [Actinomycetota bacterium]MBU4385832.1 hypothetical protein [Actinomycetota bacterium]MBU4489986.1 hypothetical protein [Actinomycetota bacterium]
MYRASRATEGRVATKVKVAIAVASASGIALGMSLMMVGCFLTWRSDSVLGLYGLSGWDYSNLVSGDGKITLALSAVGFLSLVLGALLSRRAFYGIAVACSVAALVLASYEIIFILTRPGITGPGTGLYMVLGAGVAGILAGLFGYSLLENKPEAPEVSSPDRKLDMRGDEIADL